MPWRRIARFSLGYFVIGLVALLAFDFFVIDRGPREVPYSDFIRALEARTVAEAQIGERSVLWTVRGAEQPVASTRLPGVNDESLLNQLRSSGAEFGGFWEPGGWGTLFGWLLPMLLFFGVWGLALSRFPGQTQALSLGRNRAKIYDQGDVNVTFADVAGQDEAVTELH